tara:strand:- start:57 stop:635 length:579 start_codon:yes stop_codon:yes gene_type:complete
MKRRDFCKTTVSILLAWGINPIIAYANTNNNKVLNGQLLINNSLEKGSFNDLDNALIETQNLKSIIKVNNDVFLIKPNSKLKFISNKIHEVFNGSFHGVFGKRENELIIKVPRGSIGIRGTAIYFEIDSKKKINSLCNCYGHTVVYKKNGKLLKSLINTKSDMHSAISITGEEVETISKFKHDVVTKEFLNS